MRAGNGERASEGDGEGDSGRCSQMEMGSDRKRLFQKGKRMASPRVPRPKVKLRSCSGMQWGEGGG